MKKTIILGIVCIILTLNINYNAFGIFNNSYNKYELYDRKYNEIWFNNFQNDSEALVIYKIMDSKTNGILHYNGMLIAPVVNDKLFRR